MSTTFVGLDYANALLNELGFNTDLTGPEAERKLLNHLSGIRMMTSKQAAQIAIKAANSNDEAIVAQIYRTLRNAWNQTHEVKDQFEPAE